MALNVKSFAAAIAAAVIAAAGLAGCSGLQGGSDSETLRVRIGEDPGSLDPHVANSSTSLLVAGYLYDTLVGRSSDGEVVPRLATKWEVSPNSVQFTIRDDITCSDGARLNPSDIEANFLRLQDPETKSPYVANFLGSTDYAVTSDDEAGTFSIETPKPFGALLYNLSGFPRIICPAGLADPESLDQVSQGTGPYVLDDAVSGDHYALASRADYAWGPEGSLATGATRPASVNLVVVPNDTTAANELVSGGVDLAYVNGPERERLSKDDNVEARDAAVGTTMLLINQADGHPGSDPKVREALIRSIDRDAMTQAGFDRFGDVADSLLLPSAPCYASGTGIPSFDPEVARALLDGKDLSLKVYAIGVPGSEYVSEAWREVGVRTEMNVGDEAGPGMDAVFGGGDWDAALMVFNGVEQLSTMTPLLEGAAPPKGSNVASVDNQAFSKLAAQSSASVGEPACDLATEAQREAFASSDVLPLSVVSTGYFSRPGVEYQFAGSAIEAASLTTPKN